jgi:hypothetical protein
LQIPFSLVFGKISTLAHPAEPPEQLWHTQLWINFGLFGPTLAALPNHMRLSRRVFGVLGNVVVFSATLWPTHNFAGTTQTLPRRFPKHAGGFQNVQKGHFCHPGAHIWRVENHFDTF